MAPVQTSIGLFVSVSLPSLVLSFPACFTTEQSTVEAFLFVKRWPVFSIQFGSYRAVAEHKIIIAEMRGHHLKKLKKVNVFQRRPKLLTKRVSSAKLRRLIQAM